MFDRIEKTVDLKAPIERVWKALADHVEFGTWFRVKLDGPFVPGAATAGRVTHPGYEHLRFEVRTERMDAPRLLSFRWHPAAIDPAVDYSAEPTTLVEFRLEPMATGTRLTVVESGFDALPPERRDTAFRMNEGGWAMQMTNVRTHVDG